MPEAFPPSPLPDGRPAALIVQLRVACASRVRRWRCTGLLCVLLMGLAGPGWAERADRAAPMNIEADALRYDDARQLSVFTGNVVVTKGTIVLRAARVEVRQGEEGFQFGVATAAPGGVATFRQKREGLDEYIEGEGERIEYDGQADQVKLISRAVMRRYRGETLADETLGTIITYNSTTEVFTVEGGSGAGLTPSHPGGRVRAIIAPREPTSTTTQPAAAPPAALKPSGALETPR